MPSPSSISPLLKAIIVTSTNNRAVFGVLATNRFAVLCAVATNQPSRVIPRR